LVIGGLREGIDLLCSHASPIVSVSIRMRGAFGSLRPLIIHEAGQKANKFPVSTAGMEPIQPSPIMG
jgi:hypothetical protein